MLKVCICPLIFFLNAFTVYHVILNDFGILNLSTCMKDPETKFIIVTCQIKLHQLILESHRRNQFNPWQQSQMIRKLLIIMHDSYVVLQYYMCSLILEHKNTCWSVSFININRSNNSIENIFWLRIPNLSLFSNKETAQEVGNSGFSVIRIFLSINKNWFCYF